MLSAFLYIVIAYFGLKIANYVKNLFEAWPVFGLAVFAEYACFFLMIWKLLAFLYHLILWTYTHL